MDRVCAGEHQKFAKPLLEGEPSPVALYRVHLPSMWVGSPDRSRTCIYRFVPATAFAAAFRRLWSGLSHNRGAKRALGCIRQVSTPSKREGRAWLGSGLPCLGLTSVTAKCRFPRI